jgi:hypothetical protein
MRRISGSVVAAVVIVLILATCIVAEYTNAIPCSWYAHNRFNDTPARCLKTYVP